MLAELPALSRRERRELVFRIVEIDSSEAELEDLAACEQAAMAGFAMLERMEAEDATP